MEYKKDTYFTDKGRVSSMKGIGKLAVGETLDQRAMIKQAVKGIAANGKPYLTLILTDKTGEIETKMWDTSDLEKYAPKSIVHAAGLSGTDTTEAQTNHGPRGDECRGLRPIRTDSARADRDGSTRVRRIDSEQ